MSKKQERIVYRRKDGLWVNKLTKADRASSIHQTQAEANQSAAKMLKNQGGGERTTMGRSGKIVSKDSISPGSDPRSIRDTEH